MAFDQKPSTWLGPGYSVDLINHQIKFNTDNAQASAVDTVTASGAPANNDTVTVNGRVYTFKTTLTGAADEIHINGQDGSLANLAAAINLTGTIGTDYGTGTVINANVTAGAVIAHVIILTAKVTGSSGNLLTLAKSGANLAVGGATFSGGADNLLIQLTDANADPTTGDIREVVLGIMEALYQAWLAQGLNVPAKMVIKRSANTGAGGSVIYTYSVKMTLNPPGTLVVTSE